MREKLNLTEEDGYQALRGHVSDKARAARAVHGPKVEGAALEALLADPEHLRFPTRLVFDEQELLVGEFAHARQRGDAPADGFDLCVHPLFRERPREAALAAAYHIVTINYLDVATQVEAELYGAQLHGLGVEDYYTALCALADEVLAARGAEPAGRASESCCGQGTCGH